MSDDSNQDTVLRAYAWNLRYAQQLTADLSVDQWTRHGGPGLENHATWTIGHLVTGSDMLAEDLGLERDLPESWRQLFERRGPGDPRLPELDPNAYPPLPEILRELQRQHERVDRAWRALEPPRLTTPFEWRFHGYLPTLADAALFLAVTHEAMHLGQLAAWRRALGLPSSLAAL